MGKMAWFDDKGKFLKSYVGELINKSFHGKGVYMCEIRRNIKGNGNMGKLMEKGPFTWKDRRSYIGEFKEDLKEGCVSLNGMMGEFGKEIGLEDTSKGLGILQIVKVLNRSGNGRILKERSG